MSTKVPPLKVLLVDDDEPTLEAVSLILTIEGCEVRAASGPDGVEALLADGWVPDAAVIDMMMPTKDGAQVATWVHQRYPGARVVIYSAWPGAQALMDFRKEMSADVFLAKPFDLDDLVRAARGTQ